MKLSALSAASVLLATICVATNPLTPDKVEADLKTDE